MRIALFVALLLCSGCASLRPDFVTAGYVHTSQPFVGQGPPPFGDHGRSEESDMDTAEAGLRWERGRLYYEGNLGYVLREGGHEPGNWVATFRAGVKVPL